MTFNFAYSVEPYKDGLSACKVSMLQVAFGKFYKQFKKHNDDVIMTSFHVLGFENLKFCKTGYRLSCCQASNLLVVWIKFYGS